MLFRSARRIRLTKSLGQNFLHDGNQIRRMVALAALRPNDHVIEIGPGLGPLTDLLLAGAHKVLAIEKDARLVAFLRERFAGEQRLRLVNADAVDFVARDGIDWTSWRLVAALPYSAASDILTTLALAPTCPERLVITLQQEVAQRLSVGPGSPDYGPLTLIVRHRYVPVASFNIPGSCFFPPPKVTTTCLALDRRPGTGLSASERRTFERLVRGAFGQRRKMMLKLLKPMCDGSVLRRAFDRLGISETCRAESIDLATFEDLARILNSSGADAGRA